MQITASSTHTCALLRDRSVRCWGRNNMGQLGNGNTASVLDPSSRSSSVNLDGAGSGALQVSAGDEFTCAVLVDRSVRCWGSGANGKLGNGETSVVLDPS